MKYRNKKRHGFKRLKRQLQVYDYCKTRISRGDTFQMVDIANDLGIGRSTVTELLQELAEKDSNFIYNRGCIKIKGIGNNGYGKLAEDEKGLVVKKIPRSTKSRLEKRERVFNYLCELVNSNQKIPNLTILSKHFTDMHMTTLMDILKQLDLENKVIYKHGQVIAVNVPSVKGDRERELKYNNGTINEEEDKGENDTMEITTYEPPKEKIDTSKYIPLCSTQELQVTGEIDTNVLKDAFSFRATEPTKVSIVSIDTSKYDKAVKDLVAEYILNANITTREEIVEYVDSIMKITDKLKDKLY